MLVAWVDIMLLKVPSFFTYSLVLLGMVTVG
jgi:hypothetical protein